jgi:hypothetical protein
MRTARPHQLTTAATAKGRRRLATAYAVGVVVVACSMLTGCSGGGIYAGVGIAGPSVDLGPVSINTGVSLGRFL